MDQQSLTVQPTATTGASELCSPGLRKLLIEGEDSGGACRLIALNATLRAECQRVLPVLENAKVPATDAEALEIIARRMVAYGITANAAYSHGVTWESYLSALEGLPPHAIEDAFDRWGRGEGVKDVVAAGFPPRPPQLALLAQTAKREVFSAVYRARKALEHVEKTGVEWTPERKRIEREKMIAAGYLNQDGSPNMGDLKLRGMPEHERPRQSSQEAAEAIRRSAEARDRGMPVSRRHADDVGDVI